MTLKWKTKAVHLQKLLITPENIKEVKTAKYLCEWIIKIMLADF